MFFMVGTSLLACIIQLSMLSIGMALCARKGNEKQLKLNPQPQQRPGQQVSASERSVKQVQPRTGQNPADVSTKVCFSISSSF